MITTTSRDNGDKKKPSKHTFREPDAKKGVDVFMWSSKSGMAVNNLSVETAATKDNRETITFRKDV